MTTETTGKERVLAVLQRGGWWITAKLAEEAGLQDNTCVKYVKFLRDEGTQILGRKVDKKEYNEYCLDSEALAQDRATMQRSPGLSSDYKAILAGYPVDHPERLKYEAIYAK
jgi:hypothetical protein